MTFAQEALPPVDRGLGGLWSLTMYNKDIFMIAGSPNGRVNLGTVNLDASELALTDGKLALHLSHDQPADPAARANWLPAPADQFCLVVRAYVPSQAILDNAYQFPDVIRTAPERAGLPTDLCTAGAGRVLLAFTSTVQPGSRARRA